MRIALPGVKIGTPREPSVPSEVGAACAQCPGLQAEREVPQGYGPRGVNLRRLLAHTGTDQGPSLACDTNKTLAAVRFKLLGRLACHCNNATVGKNSCRQRRKMGGGMPRARPYGYNPFARSSRRYSRMPLRRQNGCSFSPQRRGNFDPNFPPAVACTTLMRTAV